MDRPDDPAFWPNEDENPALFDSDEGWVTAEEVEADMDTLEGPYASRVDLGLSLAGKPITALRIAASPHPSYALRIVATHHGNEPISALVALDVAQRLVGDPSLIPSDAEIWIVPDVNPDGLDARTRENAIGVDLNRNYGYDWGEATNPGVSAFSEPETRAMRSLTRARCWLGGLTLHSGASNISWPWNDTTSPRSPDEPLFETVSADYLALTTAPDFWATDGADWYVTHGDLTDWAYGRWGIPELTVELDDDKAPVDVQTVLDWHADAILQWLARAPDVTAVAVSDQTGEAVPVTLGTEEPAASPSGLVARWTDAAPETWSSAGFVDAAFGDALVWDGTSVSPRVISRGDGVVRVPDGWVGLSQPGEENLTLDPTVGLDATALAPGLWDVATVDGVAPRSLLIGEVDDHVHLDGVTLVDGTLTLDGAGFGRGAEAWGVGGPVRAMHALTPVSGSPTELQFVWSEGDDAALLWTNGAWLGAVGMSDAPSWDETPPATAVLTGDATARNDPLPSAGGCAGSNATFFGIFGLLLPRRRPATYQNRRRRF